MRELIIGDLHARVPIVQGGMGVGVSLAGLAAAVANEGGIGVIASVGIGMFEKDLFTNFLEANMRALRREIAKAKEATKGILGVNILVALSDYAEYVRTAVQAGIDVIFSGAGLPLRLPEYAGPDCRTKLVPIVSSGRAAQIICRKWRSAYNRLPDAVVVEGPLAGGHLGFRVEDLESPEHQLEKLVPEVVAALRPFEEDCGRPIPTIAGGGIYTGADIHRFFGLGAAGVQMGTRFVTTTECDVAQEFKQAYLDCRKEDICIIKSPVGMPGRAIRGKFIEEAELGARVPFKCPYHCIVTCDVKNSPYCIALALLNAQRGNFQHGFAFAGANAYRADRLMSVKELMTLLQDEYRVAAQTPA